MITQLTQQFTQTRQRMSVTFVSIVAAVFVALSGTFLAFAPQAGASGTYTNVYSSLRSCQLDQRSYGHSSGIRITTACHSYTYNCIPGQCNVGYKFSYKYV